MKPHFMLCRFSPLIIGFCLLIASCDKKNDDSAVSNFTWTYEGTTYTAKTDTAYNSFSPYTGMAPAILATQNTRFYFPSPELIIHLSSLNPGAYIFTGAGSNQLRYIDPLGFDRVGTGGSLNISSNTNGRLAGNFNITLSNNISLTGSFNNVPVNP